MNPACLVLRHRDFSPALEAVVLRRGAGVEDARRRGGNIRGREWFETQAAHEFLAVLLVTNLGFDGVTAGVTVEDVVLFEGSSVDGVRTRIWHLWLDFEVSTVDGVRFLIWDLEFEDDLSHAPMSTNILDLRKPEPYLLWQQLTSILCM